MRIPLSPMDYYFLRKQLYCIQFIFEFEGKIQTQPFQTAVFQALKSFPALRARLEFISNHEANLHVPEIFEPEDVCLRILDLNTDFDVNQTDAHSVLIDSVFTIPGQPLFKMTLGSTERNTYFTVSLSHLVGDAFSLFKFLTGISTSKPRAKFRDLQLNPALDRLVS